MKKISDSVAIDKELATEENKEFFKEQARTFKINQVPFNENIKPEIENDKIELIKDGFPTDKA